MEEQDRELMLLLADGWSSGAIAGALGLERGELRARVRALFERLGMAGRSPRAAAQLAVLSRLAGD